MTDMTKNGMSTTKALGQEKYETFSRKIGRKVKKYYSYDYRNHNDELFSCVKPTLSECRAARDAWLDAKSA